MALVVLMLLREWDVYQAELIEQQPSASSAQQNPVDLAVSQTSVDDLPQAFTSDLPTAQTNDSDFSAPVTSGTNSASFIRFANDVLELQINPLGGDIHEANLLQHMESKGSQTPISIFSDNADHIYVAQSGLVGANGTDTAQGRPTFHSATQDLEIANGEDTVVLDLHYQQGQVNITKRFTLNRGDYYITIDYLIDNQSTSDWSATYYARLKRDNNIPPVASSGLGMNPFFGAAISTSEDNYKKIDFDDLRDGNLQEETTTSGWASILQQYFLAAWVPDSDHSINYILEHSPTSDLYYVGFTQSELQVAPGSQGQVSAGLYVGPKDQYRLRDIAEHLDLTVDYGWVWWAAQPMYAILYLLHEGEVKSLGIDAKVFGGITNWGICIIFLTLIVKLLFFKLSEKSYKSMARMRKIQPKMAALKERYGDDKQQFSQEMMRMYQKEKINPLGGCLPMLVQMPVFIALYWVLKESVELRHEPFFGWIVDLSAKDPWFLLPVLMGVSMWFQMRLNPAPPDPTQAKVMQMMPFIFTFMFMWFPAGLVLYWVSNNILSIAQQWYITRGIERADATAD